MNRASHLTDFDDWLVATFDRVGPFTLLIVLVAIGDTTVTPLRSSYLHVIGDETRWPEMVRLFDGSGAAWNGAALFQADRGGLIADAIARERLASLTQHIEKDRSIISNAAFFDTRGLSLRIDEIVSH